MADSWKKVTGWAAIAYVVIFVSLLFIGDFGPSLPDSPAEVREWYEDNETQVAIITFLLSAAFALILVFASGLRGLLGPADADSQGL